MGAVEHGTAAKDGLRGYYRAKIEEYELAVRDKTSNLRRLEAQRNELNQKGASNPSPREGDVVWNGSQI
jgi:26S proteasome regulatory subunit T6